MLTACNGAEAVALYAEQPQEIALVLTDMMMPGMDGAASIRAFMSVNPLVRILATSGMDSRTDLARITEDNGYDFLPKPYTAQTLLKRIRGILDRSTAVTG